MADDRPHQEPQHAQASNANDTMRELVDVMRAMFQGIRDEQELRNEQLRNGRARRQEEETRADPLVVACTYKDFMNTKPPEFQGSIDPIVASNWVRNMENVFRLYNCTDAKKKTIFASFMLRGAAAHWWDTLREGLGEQATNKLTWEDFKKSFNEKYCPRSRMYRLEDKFMNLRQGNLSVTQYAAKFVEKTRFVVYQVGTEERKARTFEKGLSPEIRKDVVSHNAKTFREVEEKAELVEFEMKRCEEELNVGQKRKL